MHSDSFYLSSNLNNPITSHFFTISTYPHSKKIELPSNFKRYGIECQEKLKIFITEMQANFHDPDSFKIAFSNFKGIFEDTAEYFRLFFLQDREILFFLNSISINIKKEHAKINSLLILDCMMYFNVINELFDICSSTSSLVITSEKGSNNFRAIDLRKDDAIELLLNYASRYDHEIVLDTPSKWDGEVILNSATQTNIDALRGLKSSFDDDKTKVEVIYDRNFLIKRDHFLENLYGLYLFSSAYGFLAILYPPNLDYRILKNYRLVQTYCNYKIRKTSFVNFQTRYNGSINAEFLINHFFFSSDENNKLSPESYHSPIFKMSELLDHHLAISSKPEFLGYFESQHVATKIFNDLKGLFFVVDEDGNITENNPETIKSNFVSLLYLSNINKKYKDEIMGYNLAFHPSLSQSEVDNEFKKLAYNLKIKALRFVTFLLRNTFYEPSEIDEFFIFKEDYAKKLREERTQEINFSQILSLEELKIKISRFFFNTRTADEYSQTDPSSDDSLTKLSNSNILKLGGVCDLISFKFYSAINGNKRYNFLTEKSELYDPLDPSKGSENEIDFEKLKLFITEEFKAEDEGGLSEIIFLNTFTTDFVENSDLLLFFFNKIFFEIKRKTLFDYYLDQPDKLSDDLKSIVEKIYHDLGLTYERQEKDFGDIVKHPILLTLYQENFFLKSKTPDKYQSSLLFCIEIYEKVKEDDRLLSNLLNNNENIIIYLLKVRSYDFFDYVINDLIARDKIRLVKDTFELFSFESIHKLVHSNNHLAIAKLAEYADRLNIKEKLIRVFFFYKKTNSREWKTKSLFDFAVKYGFNQLSENILRIEEGSDFFPSLIDPDLLFDAMRSKNISVIKKIFVKGNFDSYYKHIDFKKLVEEYSYQETLLDLFKELLGFKHSQIQSCQKPFLVEIIDSKKTTTNDFVNDFEGFRKLISGILESLEKYEKLFEKAVKRNRVDIIEIYLSLDCIPSKSEQVYILLEQIFHTQIDQEHFRFIEKLLNFKSPDCPQFHKMAQEYFTKELNIKMILEKAIEISNQYSKNIIRDLILKYPISLKFDSKLSEKVKDYFQINFDEIFGDFMNLKKFLEHHSLEKLSNLIKFLKSIDSPKLNFKDQSGKHCLDEVLEIDDEKKFAESLELMINLGAKFSEITLSEQKKQKLKNFFRQLLDSKKGDTLIKKKKTFLKSLAVDKFNFSALGLNKAEIKKIDELTPSFEKVKHEKDHKLTLLLCNISFTSLQVIFDKEILKTKDTFNKSLTDLKDQLESEKKIALSKLKKLNEDHDKNSRIKKKDQEIKEKLIQIAEDINNLNKEILSYSEQILKITEQLKTRSQKFDDRIHESVKYDKHFSFKIRDCSLSKFSELEQVQPAIISLSEIIQFIKKIEIFQEITSKRITKDQLKTDKKKDQITEEISYYIRSSSEEIEGKINQQLQIIFNRFLKENISKLQERNIARDLSLHFFNFLEENFQIDFDESTLRKKLSEILLELSFIEREQDDTQKILAKQDSSQAISSETSSYENFQETENDSQKPDNAPKDQAVDQSFDQLSENKDSAQIDEPIENNELLETGLRPIVTRKLSEYCDKDLSQDEFNQIKYALLGYSISFTSEEALAPLEHGSSHLEKINPLSDYPFGCAGQIDLDDFEQKIIEIYQQLYKHQKTPKKLPELAKDSDISEIHLKALFHNLLEQLQDKLIPISKTNFRYPENRQKILDHIYPFIAYCIGSSQGEEQYLKDYFLISQGEAGSRSGFGHASNASKEQLKQMIWVIDRLLSSYQDIHHHSRASLKKPTLNHELFIDHLKKFKKTTYYQTITIDSDQEFLTNLTILFSSTERLSSSQNQKLCSIRNQLKLLYQNKLFFLTTILLVNKINSESIEPTGESQPFLNHDEQVQDLLRVVTQELLNKIFDCEDFSIAQAKEKLQSFKEMQDKLDSSIDKDEESFFKILSDPNHNWLFKIINNIPNQDEITSVIEAKIHQLSTFKQQVAKTKDNFKYSLSLQNDDENDLILTNIKQFLTLDLIGFSSKEFRNLCIGNFREIQKSYLKKCHEKEHSTKTTGKNMIVA